MHGKLAVLGDRRGKIARLHFYRRLGAEAGLRDAPSRRQCNSIKTTARSRLPSLRNAMRADVVNETRVLIGV